MKRARRKCKFIQREAFEGKICLFLIYFGIYKFN